ncbi:MAG: hypothetical protein M3Z04_07770, partial [Chloroflexota bacterium]|nr:hypothetical protein [Chloroflexota bacterium]
RAVCLAGGCRHARHTGPVARRPGAQIHGDTLMIQVLFVASASDRVDRPATRLRAEGYAVSHAGSGEAALVWLDAALPHLLLLDWHLS